MHNYKQSNIHLCNDTIIVLKISLLHSVSVITNFVIPKRDKQTDKKHHTVSFIAGARPTIPTILGMVIKEVRPIIKIAKIGNFWYKFAQKLYTPQAIFIKFGSRGSPRSAPSYQGSPFWLLKCGPTAAKIAKNRNFWYKFAPIENFFGVHRKS